MIIDQPMTIYAAAALKPRVLEALELPEPELDLSAVAEIDSAGVQLLLLARREARHRGRRLRVTNATPEVLEVLDVLGLADLTEAHA